MSTISQEQTMPNMVSVIKKLINILVSMFIHAVIASDDVQVTSIPEITPVPTTSTTTPTGTSMFHETFQCTMLITFNKSSENPMALLALLVACS